MVGRRDTLVALSDLCSWKAGLELFSGLECRLASGALFDFSPLQVENPAGHEKHRHHEAGQHPEHDANDAKICAGVKVVVAGIHLLPERLGLEAVMADNAAVLRVETHLIGGAIITERIFAFSGMGALFNSGLQAGDPNPVMAYFVVIAIFAITFNFLADLAYSALDPRVRAK